MSIGRIGYRQEEILAYLAEHDEKVQLPGNLRRRWSLEGLEERGLIEATRTSGGHFRMAKITEEGRMVLRVLQEGLEVQIGDGIHTSISVRRKRRVPKWKRKSDHKQ